MFQCLNDCPWTCIFGLRWLIENIFSQKFSRKRSVFESSKVPTLIYDKVSCGENLRFLVQVNYSKVSKFMKICLRVKYFPSNLFRISKQQVSRAFGSYCQHSLVLSRDWLVGNKPKGRISVCVSGGKKYFA